ncbi:MAG: hypothetical protein U5L11_15625 [Arhodomonas sp.]|nr:hypothetical protein [Arhodomonas sp.]
MGRFWLVKPKAADLPELLDIPAPGGLSRRDARAVSITRATDEASHG